MSDNIYYYNIHNILKIKMRTNSKHALFKNFNFPLSPFKCETLDDVDICLNIGSFEPSLSKNNTISVDYNFYAGDDYLYIKDFEGRLGRFSWEAEFLGLNSKELTINFNSKIPLFHKLVFPDLMPQVILLRPLLYYMFAQKNASFLHSAGVCKKGRACILAGRNGSFKSSILMDLIKHHSWSSNSDENIIISNEGDVLSFPFFYPLFDYMVENLDYEDFPVLEKIKFTLSLLNEKNKCDLTSINGKLDTILILHRTNSSKISFNKIDDKNLAVRKLVLNNICEWYNPESLAGVKSGRMYEYMSMFSFVYPQFNIDSMWKAQKEILNNIVSRTKVYEVEIPLKYNHEIAEKINDFLW